MKKSRREDSIKSRLYLDFAEIKYSSLFQKEDSLAQSKKTREERLKTSQHFQLKEEVSEKQKVSYLR